MRGLRGVVTKQFRKLTVRASKSGMSMASALYNTWVVIPAYNEGNVIAANVAAVVQVFPKVVVVDDCSDDDTGEKSFAAGAYVCRHPINLGQGAALATGIEFAIQNGASNVVTFDADGQHSIEDARVMVRLREESGVDVVLGSRFLGKTVGASRGRTAFLKVATAFTRATTGLLITDTHNGLRVLSRKAAQTIKIRQNRMAHASEILHQIADNRLSYIEAPCTITYTAYSVQKGQRMMGAFMIVGDLILRGLYR
jgi:glycosyltransferase involved in cell wall biosynthesis